MYKYIFLYAAVAFLVMSLFHTEASTLTEYAMAQEEQSSNQTQIVVAQTPVEKANLERFDKLDFQAWNNRNWTAGTGTLPGNLTMVTVAHWKDGRIAQEYLFMQNPSTVATG